MKPIQWRALISAACTLALAIATVGVLHLALGSDRAEASATYSCTHSMCTSESGCTGPVWNHECCFASGSCEPLSCLISEPCSAEETET